MTRHQGSHKLAYRAVIETRDRYCRLRYRKLWMEAGL